MNLAQRLSIRSHRVIADPQFRESGNLDTLVHAERDMILSMMGPLFCRVVSNIEPAGIKSTMVYRLDDVVFHCVSALFAI
jgi:hypothetical protein